MVTGSKARRRISAGRRPVAATRWSFAVCVKQPERGGVDGKGGNEGVGNALEGRHQILTGNSRGRLLEKEPSLFAVARGAAGRGPGRSDRPRA